MHLSRRSRIHTTRDIGSGSEIVSTDSKDIGLNFSKRLAREFNTIHVPSIGIGSISRTINFAGRLQIENLLANTEMILESAGCGILSRHSGCNRLDRSHVDGDVTGNLTVTGGNRNRIDSLVVSVGLSLDRNRGSRANSFISLVRPCIGGVLVREAVDVGVQSDELALANVHLVSIHLEVRTVRENFNGCSSKATIGRSNRNRIGTGSLSGNRLGSGRITPFVSISEVTLFMSMPRIQLGGVSR